MKKCLLSFSILFFGILRLLAQNPHAEFGDTTPVLTLSHGKFEEFFHNDSVIVIEDFVFDTRKQAVIAFTNELTPEDSVRYHVLSTMEEDVSTRFLSVDPISAEYPELTPYQFAGNTPIQAIDLDGLEPASKIRYQNAMKQVIALQNDKNIKESAFTKISKTELVNYLKTRLNNPEKMNSPFYSCGPTSACYVALTHDPEQFVNVFIQLWKTGEANDGAIKASERLKTYNYQNNNEIDMALIGSLRNSESVFVDYFIPEDKKERKILTNKLKNSTLPGEYGDFINERLGLTVGVDYTGKASALDIKSWTDKGKYTVLFGYYGAFRGEKFDTNKFGGDHFITVQSLKTDKKTGAISMKYWDHGEDIKGKTRTAKFKNEEEFNKAYSKTINLSNTGN
jgi:hypothetical protein